MVEWFEDKIYIKMCMKSTELQRDWKLHDGDFWYDYCLDWIESCDALIRLPGKSVGADNEVKKALSLNIPVYFSLEEFKMFLDLKINSEDKIQFPKYWEHWKNGDE